MIKPVSHAGRKVVPMSTSRLNWSARASRVASARRPLRAPVAAIVGASLISTVAACGGNGVHAQSGPTANSTPTVSTTASAPPLDPTPRQAAATAVVSQVVAYEHTLDMLAVHRQISLDRLYQVSTQPDVTDEIAFLNHFRSRGDRQHGASKVTGTRVDAITLPSASSNQAATARVTICLDVSGVTAVDRDGKSVVAKGRKPFYRTHLTLIDRKYPDPHGWLVNHVAATEERSCSV